MHEVEPTIQTMDVADAHEHWAQLIEAVVRRGKRVVLKLADTPVAALVFADDLERLRRYEAEREADFAVLNRVGAAFADVSAEDIEREVARALAEVCTERRAATLEQAHYGA